jgi:hypothetical protein
MMILKSIQMDIKQLKTSRPEGTSFTLAVPRPCDSVQEVLDADEKLRSPDFRKALVR